MFLSPTKPHSTAFQVHEDNIRDVVACILPYHSAKAFVRAVQILRVKGKKEWAWLAPVAKHGTPMPREALVKYAASDRGVLRFVCEVAHEAVEAGSAAQSSHHVTL